MIPSGDTWGISGSTFLLAYLVLALAVGAAVLRARRALADVSAERPASQWRSARTTWRTSTATRSSLSPLR